MIRQMLSVAVLMSLVGAAPGRAAAQSEPQAKETIVRPHYQRIYFLDFLNPKAAELLAWEQCPEVESSGCSVRSSERGRMEVYADAPTHAKIARLLAQRDVAPPTPTFQITLLHALTAGSDELGSVQQGALDALTDARKLLPYRAYRVLDQALLTTARQGQARVTGIGGAELIADLHCRQDSGPAGPVLQVHDFSVQRLGESPLLRTSFTMRRGETVVVGASKLDGGSDALMVLVTAQP